MTAKGLRKCRAVHSEENQKQVSHRCPRALGNRCNDFHIPATPATIAVEKWESKSRIPTFPQRLPCPYQTKEQKTKGDQPQPETLSFRLISGLEYAPVRLEVNYYNIQLGRHTV
jgi:hypothetical protein